MFVKETSEILERGIAAITDNTLKEKSKFVSVFKEIAGYPIKVLASFIFAPFLITKIALTVKNRIRRIIAVIGLVLSLIFSYLAATFLGTLAGAAFVASKIGFVVAIGFFVGTTLSVYLSVIFSILVFNAVSFVFLKLSSKEIIDYLNKIST